VFSYIPVQEFTFMALPSLLGDTFSYSNLPVSSAVTATASGTISTSALLTTTVTYVGTVATAGDALRLPVGVAGAWVIVHNNAANSMNIFPNTTGDKVGSAAASAALAVPAGKAAMFVCLVPTSGSAIWAAIVSA
jgi:hypothetical protein